jgi:hypothetical protein
VRCLIHWVRGFPARFASGIGTHWVRWVPWVAVPTGCAARWRDPRRRGAIHGGAAQSINRASGSMGAGEGRSKVGCWPGGITETVKIF